MAFYLYRGKLHQPPEIPREWPMPRRAINPEQFRTLTQRRDRALARLAEESTKADRGGDHEEREKKKKDNEEEIEEEVAADVEESSSKGPEKEVEMAPVESAVDLEMKENKGSVNDVDKEKRIKEVEAKLEVLNKKKHDLVQILKQILNAEEEYKRRNALAAAARASVPMQTEYVIDMGSATRHVPKLSVEVNFGGDSGAESDATGNHHSQQRHANHLPNTSPSAGPFVRHSHQNTPTSRASLGTNGYSGASNVTMANNTAAATSSPSRFALNGHHSLYHSSSFPPGAAPSAHLVPSSLSPAASGGASSAFRDSRVTSSS